MKYYYITENYISKFSKLADVVPDADKRVLKLAGVIDSRCREEDFDGYSMILLDWAGDVIKLINQVLP